MSETPETSIVVRFSTKLNGYQIPLTSFNIPSTSTRLTLSKLINHLLSLPQTVPFDFIISNEFLRTTLEEHLKTHEISSERIIDIEYTLALPAPQTEWSCQQENWISELSFTDNFVFSALSNQTISVNGNNFSNFGLKNNGNNGQNQIDGNDKEMKELKEKNENGEKKQIKRNEIISNVDAMLSFGTTKRPVKCVDSYRKNDEIQVICGGKSNNLTVFDFHVKNAETQTNPIYFDQTMILQGHKGSIEDVAFNPNGNFAASCSWDKTINIWDLNSTGKPFTSENVSINENIQNVQKRSKKQIKVIEEFTPLTGHTQTVTKCIWPVEKQILSASLDNTISIWDVQQTAVASAYKTSKTTTSLDYSLINSLIVSGHNDAVIRICDPREEKISMKLMKSHKNLVTCVRWHPQSAYLLLSSGYDNSVKIWDIRSATPLCTLPFDTKMTAICWNDDGTMFYSAGASGMLKAHSFVHATQKKDE